MDTIPLGETAAKADGGRSHYGWITRAVPFSVLPFRAVQQRSERDHNP